MELYRKVRLACRDGMSERAAARHVGVSRQSVRKMLQFSVPPGYRRTAPVRRPKLDEFPGLIEQWLEDDRRHGYRKQRHTAKRIFERLRDEHGFTGGYTIVKDYVREHRRHRREMFVPLPGHAQADFGEAWAVIAGVKQKVHFFAFDLPQSDASYVRAYRAATAEAWVDGHVHAFSFFGAVALSIVYDNDRCLVSRIERDGTRRRTRLFSGFLSHYLIGDRYGRPGKGNDKGAVEGLVGWSRRNFMVPLPRFASLEALNLYLEQRCRERQSDVLRGHRESIAKRLERDLEAMTALPGAPFDACHQAAGQVSSQSLVRYHNNDYSVPVAYGYRQVWVRGYVDRVVIGCGAEVIARHPRSYEGEDMVFDPTHYLPLIERKTGALDQAAPLAGWELPDAFATLRRLMEARSGRAGRREYVQVLRLFETFGTDDVHAAVTLFPNFVFGLYLPDQIGVHLDVPLAPDRTLQRRAIYSLGPEPAPVERAEQLARLWRDVHLEDHAMCQRLQQGRASDAAAGGGVLSPVWEDSVREDSVRSFQELVVNRLR